MNEPAGPDAVSDSTTDAGRARLVRSSAAVATGTLLSRVTGLLRVIALAAALGKATLADTYNLANTTPNILYELLVGGVLAATLVPVFVEQIHKRNERSISAVFTVVLTTLLAFSTVAMVLTPLIARLFALGSTGDQHAAQVHVLTILVLCFVPQIVFYGFEALSSATLNAHRRFVAAAYAPVLNNLVVISVLVVFIARTANRSAPVTDAEQVRNDLDLLLLLGLGTTAGIVVMATSLIPAMWRARIRIRFVFDARDRALRTILRLSGWTVAYVITNQLAQLLVLMRAKTGDAGDVSAYVYAFTFYVVPHGLIAVSIMTTMMPEFARRAATGDHPGLRREFGLALRYIVVLIAPAAVLFGVLAQPMLSIIVRNQFSAHDAAITADTLQVFALSLVPFSVYLYAMRAFYALQDTRTPFFLNLFENGVNIALALALFPVLGVQGLAYAWGAAYLVGALAALGTLRRRIGPLPGAVAASAGRAVVAAAVMAVVTAPIAAALGRDTPARALVATAAAAIVGGGVYLGALVALRADELGELWTIVRRRARSASPEGPSPESTLNV